MKCLLCHNKISRIRAWRTGSEFCSDEHAAVYKKQTLERLLTEPDVTERPPVPALNLAQAPAGQEPELASETATDAAPEPQVWQTFDETAPSGAGLPPETAESESTSDEHLQLMEFDSNELPPPSDTATDDHGLEELWKLADEVGESVTSVEAYSGEDALPSLTPGWEQDLGGSLTPLADDPSPMGGPAPVTTQSADEALAALRALARGGSQEASEQPTANLESAEIESLSTLQDPPELPAFDGDPFRADASVEDWQQDLSVPRLEDSDYELPDLASESSADPEPSAGLPYITEEFPALDPRALSDELDEVASDAQEDAEQTDSTEADLGPEFQLVESMPTVSEEDLDAGLGKLSQTLESIGAGPAPDENVENLSAILSEANETLLDEFAPDAESHDSTIVQFPAPEDAQAAAGAAPLDDLHELDGDLHELDGDLHELDGDSHALVESAAELGIQPLLALTSIGPTFVAGQAEAPSPRSDPSSEPVEPSWLSTLEVWASPTAEAADGPVQLREAGGPSASEPHVAEARDSDLPEAQEAANTLLEPIGLVILAAAEEPEEETFMEAVPL